MVVKVLFLTHFEACVNVINTVLQDLIYWVRVLYAPIFHICTGENLVEIIHFAHCKPHHTLAHLSVLLIIHSAHTQGLKSYSKKLCMIYVCLTSKGSIVPYPQINDPQETCLRRSTSWPWACTQQCHPLTAFCHWPWGIGWPPFLISVTQSWCQSLALLSLLLGETCRRFSAGETNKIEQSESLGLRKWLRVMLQPEMPCYLTV
jgi:hypothetical protein